MRGEDTRLHPELVPHRGSPPHARGRQAQFDLADKARGITPACAGKTIGSMYATEPSCGSPPHARGRLTQLTNQLDSTGITPACAGKTFSTYRSVDLEPDHPRMRGEDRRVSAP